MITTRNARRYRGRNPFTRLLAQPHALSSPLSIRTCGRPKEQNVSIVAGADFGTLSVRISIFDRHRGVLARATAEYPLHRSAADPDFATQSHADQMTALAAATQRRHRARPASTAPKSKPSPSTPPAPPSSPSAKTSSRSPSTTSGATTAPTGEAAEITAAAHAFHGGTASKASTGAAASTPPSGAGPSSSTGSATTPNSAPTSSPPSNTATWSPPPSAASPTPPRSRAASAPWATSGCGTPTGAASRPKTSSSPSTRSSPASATRSTGRYDTSDKIAGHLTAAWAAKLGLTPGIPIPVGAFDAHWDAIGANIRLGDVVNVIGTSTCIIGISRQAATLIPGVCGVVPGSVYPDRVGIEAGLSAVGDIFAAIATRAGNHRRRALRRSPPPTKPARPASSASPGITATAPSSSTPPSAASPSAGTSPHTAADEFFAAIEGTAMHTRIILERMEDNGAPHPPRHQRRRHPQAQPHPQPGLRQRPQQARPRPRRRRHLARLGHLRLPRRRRLRNRRRGPGRPLPSLHHLHPSTHRSRPRRAPLPALPRSLLRPRQPHRRPRPPRRHPPRPPPPPPTSLTPWVPHPFGLIKRVGYRAKLDRSPPPTNKSVILSEVRRPYRRT